MSQIGGAGGRGGASGPAQAAQDARHARETAALSPPPPPPAPSPREAPSGDVYARSPGRDAVALATGESVIYTPCIMFCMENHS